jgi:hypothetical protein
MVKASPFVNKLKMILRDPNNKNYIFWNDKDSTLIVLKPEDFSIKILPFYFKHCNFSSFVRQLNLYGFHKVELDLWVFRHENPSTNLVSGFQEIVRRRNIEKKGVFLENLSLESRISNISILEQRTFFFLSKIFDLTVSNYNSIKKLIKLVKIVISKVFPMDSKNE